MFEERFFPVTQSLQCNDMLPVSKYFSKKSLLAPRYNELTLSRALTSDPDDVRNNESWLLPKSTAVMNV